MTDTENKPPPVCRQCGSAVYRLSLQGTLARWRARLTRQRPFACAECGWQGWLSQTGDEPAVIDQLPWFRAIAPRRNKRRE
ncbi:MAG: hypothetical protein U0Z53_06695 [Blastocatellia bacterium]